MANKYSRYELKPYIRPYVDDNSVNINKLLRSRYEANLAANDVLDDALQSMTVADFQEDQELANELRTETRGRLENMAERGDYESLGMAVRNEAKNFKKKYAPIEQNYAAYTSYKDELLSREDLTPDQKSERLASAKNAYDRSGGMTLNNETGQYEGFFSGRQWANAVDLTEEASQIAKDMEADMVSTGGWFEESPGSGIYVKAGREGLVKTAQDIQRESYEMLMSREDVKAYLNDEAYMAQQNYSDEVYATMTPEEQEFLDGQAKLLYEGRSDIDNIDDARKFAYGQNYVNSLMTDVTSAVSDVYAYDHTKRVYDIKFDNAQRERAVSAMDLTFSQVSQGDMSFDPSLTFKGLSALEGEADAKQKHFNDGLQVLNSNLQGAGADMNNKEILEAIGWYNMDMTPLEYQNKLAEQGISVTLGQAKMIGDQGASISESMHAMNRAQDEARSVTNMSDVMSTELKNAGLFDVDARVEEIYNSQDNTVRQKGEGSLIQKTFTSTDWDPNQQGLLDPEGREEGKFMSRNEIKERILTGETRIGFGLNPERSAIDPNILRVNRSGIDRTMLKTHRQYKDGLENLYESGAMKNTIAISDNDKNPLGAVHNKLKEAINVTGVDNFEIKTGNEFTMMSDLIAKDLDIKTRNFDPGAFKVTQVSSMTGINPAGSIYINYEYGSGASKKVGTATFGLQQLQVPELKGAMTDAIDELATMQGATVNRHSLNLHSMRMKHVMGDRLDWRALDAIGNNDPRMREVVGGKGEVFQIPGIPMDFSLGYRTTVGGEKVYIVQGKPDPNGEFMDLLPAGGLNSRTLAGMDEVYAYLSMTMNDLIKQQ